MNTDRKKNLKFIKLYKTFSEKEKIEFREFLKNEKENGRNYIQILDSIIVNETGKVEIGGAKSKVTKWNRFSELLHLAEKFIIIRSYKEKSLITGYLLMKEYEERKLFSSFENTYKTHRKNISDKAVMDYDINIIDSIENLHINILEKNSDVKQYQKNISELADFKLSFILVNLLEYVIEKWIWNNRKMTSDYKIEEDIIETFEFDKILLNLSERLTSQNGLYPTLKFLNHLRLCIKDFYENDNFENAKKIFFKELSNIAPEKREKYYSLLISIGIEKYNRGNSEAGEDLFLLINKKLNEGFTGDLENKDIMLNNFRNYIHIALNINKIKWVNDFIIKYGPYLQPEIRDDLILFGKAIVMNKNKDFKSCKELLDQIKRKNPYIFVDVSVLKIKVLFELNLHDKCFDELKKFNEYLRKERTVNELLIKYAKNFCKAFSLLLKINQNPVKKNILDLEIFLSRNVLIGKKWIIEKSDITIPNKIQINKT
ncbi:MAG: hypothetical protein KDD00_15835 [Ignavibacteriae bacterium]|nr:hypothetical protein [Ignavibacteriota bacterium]